MSPGTPPDAVQRSHSRLPISTANKTRIRPVCDSNILSSSRASSFAERLDSQRKNRLGEPRILTGPSTTLNLRLESVRDRNHRRSISLSDAFTSLERSTPIPSYTHVQAARRPAIPIRSGSSMSQQCSRMEQERPQVLIPCSENRTGAAAADQRISRGPMTRSKAINEKHSSEASSIFRRYGTPSSTIDLQPSPLRTQSSQFKRPIQHATKSTSSSTPACTTRMPIRPLSMVETPSTYASTSTKPATGTYSNFRRPISSMSIASSSPTTVKRRTASSATTTATIMPPQTARGAIIRQVDSLKKDDGSVQTAKTKRLVSGATSSRPRVDQTPSRVVRPLAATIGASPPRKITRSIAASGRVTENLTVGSKETVPPVQSFPKSRMSSEQVKSTSSHSAIEIASPPARRIAHAKARLLSQKERRQTVSQHGQTAADKPTICDIRDSSQKAIDSFDLKGENDASWEVLKRIQEALSTGKLELSHLELPDIPDELYQFFENGQENCVIHFKHKGTTTLNSFAATDNSIEKLDVRFAEVFSHLVSVDLRHNGLRKLPPSMSRLHSLKVLNLGANKLTNESLSVLFTISSLVDLDLQSNRLDGELPSSLCNLSSLEALNVSVNEFSSIAPTAFRGLCNLKRLNIKSNKLRTFPFCSIENVPIIEINLSYNRISGSLISIDRLSRFSELRVLKVNHNQIKVVSDFAIILPSLEILDLNSNMVSSLGMLLICTPSLAQLHIARNMMPDLPEGITELPNLKILDISYNLFLNLDPRLGLIDSLESLRWDGNRVGERSLAAMDTKDVKTRLRARYEKEISAKERQHEHGISDDLLEIAVQKRLTRSKLKVKALDLSGREYSDFPDRLVEQYMPAKYCRYGSDAFTDLHLQRNKFSTIPNAIMSFAFADTLQRIDISHNNLGDEAFMSPVSLSSLLELNLSCNSINSLIMFVANFQLRSLQKLDMSFNKIHDVPLNLVKAFSTLEELNLHENKISEIDADAFNGLEKIDLSNNSIGYLPPELGKIKTIVELKVQGNTFKTPRWQIVQKGTDALMHWLRLRLPEDNDAPVDHEM
ncbi:hypothetical protein V1506DRAFT_534352 [Lipomyces tetrasporus]